MEALPSIEDCQSNRGGPSSIPTKGFYNLKVLHLSSEAVNPVQ